MFRKPREEASNPDLRLNSFPTPPSTGRPPTPPPAGQQLPRMRDMASTAAISSTTPLIGRSKTLAPKAPISNSKIKGAPNGNIMNFFKKAKCTGKEEDEGLFLESSAASEVDDEPKQMPTPPSYNLSSITLHTDASSTTSTSNLMKFNEDTGSVKRRRLDPETKLSGSNEAPRTVSVPRGPFADSDDDEPMPQKVIVKPANTEDIDESGQLIDPILDDSQEKNRSLESRQLAPKSMPPLKREATSIGNIDDFDGIEDFIDDEFAEGGEEYIERQLMEEQARIEAEIEDQDGDSKAESDVLRWGDCSLSVAEETSSSTCPICGGETTGLAQEQISVHVNDCLDGKAKPLGEKKTKLEVESKAPIRKPVEPILGKKFQRAAIARPGQESPFKLVEPSGPKSSAFSKLMSGHAEDNAWATAAATEVASRGKPAYQRTCPFYKIMPGFFICVDAFRYGAVEGCEAYFLSHFHSDHYIGLTSSWCHGPIYCSHVTANLVRRQLRVDPKWVVDLEFEKKVEVPNTHGVDVTMIPANHCPGSSLYLFERAIAKGNSLKVQRVLHCGDFRACPAHVQHPELRPEFFDRITGRMAQQRIDVCYLDTTYLTPKYAFPNQETVIRACSQMCVSLSKDFVDESDSWEQVKRERAGEGMVRFVQRASIKEEPPDDVKVKTEDDSSPNRRPRGRLLVIVGTYSIGKERICLGVAKALKSKIYAPPNKQKVVAALEDPELSALMTDDPYEAQVHMQMLMEIRAETLADYLTHFKPRFSRIVGFRPSGWNYRPPSGRLTESPSVQTVLHSENWKSRFTMSDLVPQRGSTREANCFGVPYSEHSSFRELTMFCCALRIDKIIPTVNVGSAKSREKMKGWIEKWALEKKKVGLFKVADDQVDW